MALTREQIGSLIEINFPAPISRVIHCDAAQITL